MIIFDYLEDSHIAIMTIITSKVTNDRYELANIAILVQTTFF